MAEHALNHKIRDAVKKHGHGVRIENMVGIGTPDWNICIKGTETWLEAKWVERWPKNRDTVVDVSHYTPQQRLWARTRAKAGGRIMMALQVGADYLVFTGATAADIVGHGTRHALIMQATLVSLGRFPERELLNLLGAGIP